MQLSFPYRGVSGFSVCNVQRWPYFCPHEMQPTKPNQVWRMHSDLNIVNSGTSEEIRKANQYIKILLWNCLMKAYFVNDLCCPQFYLDFILRSVWRLKINCNSFIATENSCHWRSISKCEISCSFLVFIEWYWVMKRFKKWSIVPAEFRPMY